MVRRFLTLAVTLAAVGAGGAIAAVTSTDPAGTVIENGAKVFPLVLAKGPDAGATTPGGSDALAEIASAGATTLKIGPATTAWTSADIADAERLDRAAAAHGLSTWVNLSTESQATPGSTNDALLAQVVSSLKADPGAGAIALWKGADEPLFSGISPAALQFAYCRATGRGSVSWCGSEPVLDSDHAWVTVEAPRGTAPQLEPYSSVTDLHGVDVYPVTLAAPAPDLHAVGRWTSTLAQVTPNRAVWTTIQICASGSSDSASGTFILPTFAQERYMAYDAIINGARSLAFYGGNIAGCFSPSDRTAGWNWTFWGSVLKPLLGELNSLSPLAPALVNGATTQAMTTSDSSTQAISRAGAGTDLWVIAARGGSGSAAVTMSGLPAGVTNGTVYTEGRSIAVANGTFTDDFSQWAVHVYQFVPSAAPLPTIASFAPASGSPGTTVAIRGANLGGATAVEFGTVAAAFSLVSAGEIDTTVPAGAATAPIRVTTGGGTAVTSVPFTLSPVPPPPPDVGSGGSSSSMPDLSVTLVPRLGSIGPGDADEVIASVRNAGGTGSLQTHLAVQLPPTLSLLGPPFFERGSGCVGTSSIDCFLDYIPGGQETRVILEVRASAPGAQTISATVSSDRDSNLGNNTAMASVQVAAATPPLSPTSPGTVKRGKTLNGDARANRLTGTAYADVLNGFGGNDVLEGGGGDDILTGGSGNDILKAGPGSDTVRARDGSRDTVDCGAGRDLVLADRVDRVARNCEQVRRR